MYHCALKSEHLGKVRKAQSEMEIFIDSAVQLGTVTVEVGVVWKTH